MLCSINDRLGGGEGQSIEPLSGRWIADFATLARIQDNEPGNAGELWRMMRENL